MVRTPQNKNVVCSMGWWASVYYTKLKSPVVLSRHVGPIIMTRVVSKHVTRSAVGPPRWSSLVRHTGIVELASLY